MSKYICPNCKKDFKQKINFVNHTINKKVPCEPKPILINEKSISDNNNIISSKLPPTSSNLPPISSDLPPISSDFTLISSDLPPTSSNLPPTSSDFTPEITSEVNNEFINNLLHKIDDTNAKILLKNENNHLKQPTNTNCCLYCDKFFSRNDNLQRHLNGRCKAKIYFDDLQKLKNKLHYLADNYKDNIQPIINNMNNTSNTNNNMSSTNNTNNGLINNGMVNNGSINNGNTINIVQFGKEDLSKCNVIEMMGIYLKSTGGNIFSNILKYLNFNPKYPENFNILMTDLSREIVKIHNGKKFISKKFKNVKSDILNVLNEHITNMCDTYIENPNTKKNEDILSKIKINNISAKLINNDDIRPLLKNKKEKSSKDKLNNDAGKIKSRFNNGSIKIEEDTDSESDIDELDLEGEKKLVHYENKRQGLQEIAAQRLKDELYNNKDLVEMHHKFLTQ